MIMRHAEKPGRYQGQYYPGVDPAGKEIGEQAGHHLAMPGWQRAAALVTLFAEPWGPKEPILATPRFLFASKPGKGKNGGLFRRLFGGGKQTSRRSYETLLPLSVALASKGRPMKIHSKYAKWHYEDMVADALECDGPVLISWQHECVPLLNEKGEPGISQCILTQTQTPAKSLNIPKAWPVGPNGARYDLIWVFDRPGGRGPITGFTLFPEFLLPGDVAAPLL